MGRTTAWMAFHNVVDEGYLVGDEVEEGEDSKHGDLHIYWMHLEVAAGTTLTILDRFLRDTWLECCGHRDGVCGYTD
jgi:hypothetical protein